MMREIQSVQCFQILRSIEKSLNKDFRNNTPDPRKNNLAPGYYKHMTPVPRKATHLHLHNRRDRQGLRKNKKAQDSHTQHTIQVSVP